MSVSPPAVRSEEPELHLLPPESVKGGRGHWANVGLISIGLHVFLLLGLQSTPAAWWQGNQPAGGPEIVRRSTPLVAPRLELTQKDPNKVKVAKQIDLASLLSRPQPTPASPAPPAPPRPAPPRPAAAAPPAAAPPKAPAAESPAVAKSLPPPPGVATANPNLPAAPPPQIQVQEPPKLAFETPGAANTNQAAGRGSGLGRLAPPRNSVEEAMRGSIHDSRGGMVVGDSEDGGSAIGLPGARSSNRQSSNIELLSDTQGVDFRSYLIRVLTAVRRNWMAVVPESAKYGGVRGKVTVQFAISRDGSVRKIVFANTSGTVALDRAAIAGVSASAPFPSLPPEFTGPEIRLQLNFLYNVK